MATYPIKMLKDESNTPFVPLVSTACIRDPQERTLEQMLANKLETSNFIAGTNISLSVSSNNITIANTAQKLSVGATQPTNNEELWVDTTNNSIKVNNNGVYEPILNGGDTGWINCVLSSGVSTPSGGVPLAYRVIGKVLYLRGQVSISNVSWAKSITVVPYKVSVGSSIVCRDLGSSGTITIGNLPDGNQNIELAYLGDGSGTTENVEICGTIVLD